MSTNLAQWDIVKVRINPNDRDERPAVLISPPATCADEKKYRLNVLTTPRLGFASEDHNVLLDSEDGLEGEISISCAHFYTIDRARISARLGSVAHERRRQIGRKIIATYRLPI